MAKTRAAVIGVGPAGLVALYCLQKRGNYEIVAFDRSEMLGGTWYLSQNPDRMENGYPIYGSTYKGMQINSTHSVIQIHPDFPFPKTETHYPTREDIQLYLMHFANKFDLQQYIRFQNDVIDIKHDTEAEKLIFTIKDLTTGQVSTELFDYVFLAVGQNRLPRIPDEVDLSKFSGTYLHYHHLKDPTRFFGKRILVVGSSWAAMDLVTIYAKNVTGTLAISYRRNIPFFRNSCDGLLTVHQKMTSVEGTKVNFADGTSVDVDVIIFATGFEHVHPFTGDLALKIGNNGLFPMYKHVVHPACPRIFILGKADYSIIATMRVDAEFGIAIMDGRVKVPSRERMMLDIKRMEERWGPLLRKAAEFDMGRFFPLLELESELANEKAAAAGIPGVPRHIFCLLYDTLATMRDDCLRFRLYREKPFVPGEEPDDGKWLLPPIED